MTPRTAPSVIYEMLLSFVALADTLNLTRAVNRLGSTRQTVRRHVATLEEILGERLFELVDRHYRLTEAGADHLDNAKAIVADTENWLSGRQRNQSSPRSIRLIEIEEGWLHLQQHPLSDVWKLAPPLLQRGLELWTRARAQLEDRAMNRIRPYLVIHRRVRDDWICVHVGDKSSYATWLGWSWAKSALGSTYETDPLHSDADRFLVDVYEAVDRTGGLWYDHVFARFPRKAGAAPEPVLYQRLVFSCAFPDQNRAVAALVARTNNVVIPRFAGKKLPTMQPSDLMEFEV